jgi:hypothetical protein
MGRSGITVIKTLQGNVHWRDEAMLDHPAANRAGRIYPLSNLDAGILFHRDNGHRKREMSDEG